MHEHDDDSKRIQELLGEAASVPTTRRQGWLEGLDDPPEIVDQLRRALGEDETANSPTPSTPVGDTALPPTERVEPPGVIEPDPVRIGPYEVKRRLGAGGFGVVFLAHQEKPIRRDVALKVVRTGMAGSNILLRFEAERQALALMSHPGLAKVIDAGTTDRGDPYFVMEYVEGHPIDEVCDDEKLDIRARLELFIEVCEAIQHAHGKGIIHRDLKPGNILASVDGRRILPRVIDFGIAKALDPDTIGTGAVTMEGQFIGTPHYMAPEQTGFTGEDVDVRADVFSLGAVLYELLVGRTPIDGKTIAKARESSGIGGLQRLLCERPLIKPSARLMQCAKEAPLLAEVIAQDRSTDVRGLARSLRGDLDWILFRALERERDRRYSTPIELANDLRRHLDHEPVKAGPPSHVYRFSKFVRRNRAGVIAVFVVFIALVAAAIYSNAARLNAEHRLQETESTLAYVDDSITGQLDPSYGGGQDLLALDFFSSGYQAIASDPSLSPRVKVRLYEMYAGIFLTLMEYETAEECALLGLALVEDSSVEDEVGVYANDLRFHLARALRDQGKQADAIEMEESIDEDTPEHHNARAFTLHNAGDYDGARWYYGRERTLRAEDGDSFELAECLQYLGRLDLDEGRIDSGTRLIEASAQMCAGLSESNGAAVAASWLARGAAEAANLRLAEALEYYRDAHDLYFELHGTDDVFMVELCRLEVDGLLEDAVVLGSPLVTDVPAPKGTFNANFIEAMMLRNRARILYRAGERSAAEGLFERSLAMPEVSLDFHRHTMMAQALLLAESGEFERALTAIEGVLAEMSGEQTASAPGEAPARVMRAELLIELGRLEEARLELDQLEAIRGDFPDGSPPRETLRRLRKRLKESVEGC